MTLSFDLESFANVQLHTLPLGCEFWEQPATELHTRHGPTV